jgi:ankyrin repeat protein
VILQKHDNWRGGIWQHGIIKFMKTKFLILIFLLAAAAARAQTNNLTALLQQGLLEEQANRNLDAAIADYRALAAEFDKDRQLAATAVFRLGECYRAQGKTNEATAQYQRILREFPDQEVLATMSRQNLTGLGVSASTTSSVPMLSDSVRREQKNLLDQEIKLFEQQLESQQLMVKTGLANPDTVLATQEKLLELKRQLAALDAGQPESIQVAAPTDGEEQEIQSIRQMVQNSPDLVNRSSGETRLTPLCVAASKGHSRVAEFLLANGAEINLRSAYGITPLQSAARAGQNAMVELLLDHNAVVDAGGETPLHEAAERGFKAVAETLLAHHANVNAQNNNDGRSPLQAAAQSGSAAIVELLLSHGANVNIKDNQGRTPLIWAVSRDQNESVVKALLEAKADPNAGELDLPLLCAIHIQDAASAEMLLQAGANPNAKGNVDWAVANGGPVTPLFLAIPTKQLPLVQLLLKFKADPNDSQTDGHPVLFAALADPNILEALLGAGAKVDSLETVKIPKQPLVGNYQSIKWMPLDAAAEQNDADAVGILLKHGANPNTRGEQGETALHWATLFKPADEKVFSLLLDDKANPNVRDDSGKTPLDLVKEKLLQYHTPEQKSLVDLLHQHGALDNLPNWDRIEVTPSSAKFNSIVFRKGTNDWNRFTLLEAILNYFVTGFEYRFPYGNNGPMLPNGGRLPDGSPIPGTVPIPKQPANTMPFPDLTRVVIVRPSHGSTNATRITVNLLNATNGVDCSKDVPLEFGDMVEIPERDHSLGDAPVRLTDSQVDSIVNFLHGTVQLVVHGQKAALPLDPIGDASTIGAVLRQTAAQQLILSSSDLSHVKVTRHDPKTGKESQWILDCGNSQSPSRENSFTMPLPLRPGSAVNQQVFAMDGDLREIMPPSSSDLWLRDGDEIEVPEKP